MSFLPNKISATLRSSEVLKTLNKLDEIEASDGEAGFSKVADKSESWNSKKSEVDQAKSFLNRSVKRSNCWGGKKPDEKYISETSKFANQMNSKTLFKLRAQLRIAYRELNKKDDSIGQLGQIDLLARIEIPTVKGIALYFDPNKQEFDFNIIDMAPAIIEMPLKEFGEFKDENNDGLNDEFFWPKDNGKGGVVENDLLWRNGDEKGVIEKDLLWRNGDEKGVTEYELFDDAEDDSNVDGLILKGKIGGETVDLR
ncbi:hypothetical protein BVY03_02055 [bacterium K02(2017)]|nr:hypothetical protein BVY03_02055 [bacterium K02(2017)]